MGEKENKPFQLTFNGFLKVDFQGSRVTSDGGLILIRELDERLGLGKLIDEHLTDSRQGTNKKFPFVDLVRQSVYSRLAGYQDLNDAVRVSADPTFRLLGSKKNWDRGGALTSRLQSFEAELLASEENLLGLMAVNRELVAQAQAQDQSERVVLDMDSTESPVHGQQEGSAYNGHFESTCYHPLLLFNQHGDCLAAKLRPGNVSSAEDWDELLLPEIKRQQGEGQRVTFRADAAFAKPAIYEALEDRGVDYVMRIPANKNLELEIEDIAIPSAGQAEPEAAGALQELPLSGRELVEAPAGCGQGGAPPRRVVSSRRVHRHEHALAQPLAGAVLQQARHGRAVDQRGQAGDELDASVVSSLPGKPSAAATRRSGLQPGQSLAATGTATAHQELVADEPAAAADEDGRAAGEACSLLLVVIGRGTSEPQAVRRHAAQDLGAATAERVERSLASAKSGCCGVKLGGVSEKLPSDRRMVPFGERKGPVQALRSGPVRARGQERLAFKRE